MNIWLTTEICYLILFTIWTAIFSNCIYIYLKMIKLFLWFSNRYMCSVIFVMCIWTPPCGPSRHQVHFASRIIYIINCIRTSELILRWRRSVYLSGSALTFSGLWWCGLSSPCSTVPSVLFCIFYYLNWIYNIWYELNENYYCEIVHASVCSLPLCIIIIIHWAILAQPTFLLFFSDQ